jgi:hypothetical protein
LSLTSEMRTVRGTRRLRGTFLFAVGLAATSVLAQRTSTLSIPPIHPIGAILARTTTPIHGGPDNVRVLSDGRVLVHDIVGKQVLLFDADLAHAKAIIDTTSETAKAYGAGGDWLFTYTADSSLFLDIEARAFLVVDPAGKIARIMAAPHDPRFPRLAPIFLLGAPFDGLGHLVYYPMTQVTGIGPRNADGSLRDASGPITLFDSVPLARVQVNGGHVDTLPEWLGQTPRYASGNGILLRDPVAEADWSTVLADGTVAIVRSHDYHIDLVSPDNHVTHTPRIAHEWVHLTDSAKVAMVDSARLADSLRAVQDTIARGGYQGILEATPVQPPPGGTRSREERARMQLEREFDIEYVVPQALPDYLPPFLGAALGGGVNLTRGPSPVLADADDRIWIHASLAHPPAGGPVFDIVTRAGVLVDRVQIPGATTIVGFGPGVVYLMAREGTGVQLARARIR